MRNLQAGKMSLEDIAEEFEVKKRTAQRWMASVRSIVPDEYLREEELEYGRKRFWISEGASFPIEDIQGDELAALDEAVKLLKLQNQGVTARLLRQLGTKVRNRLPPEGKKRNDPNLDILAEARGLATRPGPRIQLDLEMLDAINQAIVAPNVIRFTYHSVGAREPKTHEECPIGIIVGRFQHLICFPRRRPKSFKVYRLDRLKLLSVLEETFRIPTHPTIQEYATQFFALETERPGKPQRVKWRFTPKARHEAKRFQFHPTQKGREKTDHTYEIEFEAAGLKEMCWELFRWEGEVEILHPPELKKEMKNQLDIASKTLYP